ncbi:VCBS repeat-containing protein [Spirosoma pomorum]
MKKVVYGLCLAVLTACSPKKTLFEKTDAEKTGITFANQLTETERENILAFEYFYNGGGVAAGDLNNDGLPDLYFTGNQVGNKLYVNKGNLTFDDLTKKAGVEGRTGGWKTGVTLADVNADGWLDIYVCYSGLRPDSLRKNQLFINNHNLTFTDKAEEYGLADSGYSVQANFFDYDLDGDLDCFLINHGLSDYQRKEAVAMRSERDYNAGDKLLRNELTTQGRFIDVSEQEGIKGNPLGFGLGVAVSDVNGDGYPDVYVTNDFVEDDYLYVNQRSHQAKGPAFRDELRERVAHTSYSSMGVDIADINNDTLPDILTLDMLPEDNARQKLLLWPDSWSVYQAQLQNGFWHQNMRNMLQLQQHNGQFSEIGQIAGVSNTDWSWGALLADFDLDGRKDIFISNGLGRDLTNADFVKYASEQEEQRTGQAMLEQLKQMPSTPTKNYIFQNTSTENNTVSFTNRQAEWGFDENIRANGSAYADLDGDGDLEIITNNLNETAHIYKNTSREQEIGRFLKIKLKGGAANPFGVGATVQVEQGGSRQVQEFYPTRGYLASSHDQLLFGLPKTDRPVNVTVRWPNGLTQTVKNVALDQALTLSIKQADKPVNAVAKQAKTLLTEVSEVNWQHVIKPTNDFERQLMLPMHYSYTGPRLAVGDVNGDGEPDAYVGGTPEQPGTLLMQKASVLTPQPLTGAQPRKNTDAVFADFNGDKQPDLYVVNGGYGVRDTTDLQDQLWLNYGTGKFNPATLPTEGSNGSCVKAFDVDKDGDIDLFVGGHVRPGKYPYADQSFLLINDGKAQFRQISLGKLGLVSDAAVVDMNKDGWLDLVIVGEWMPVTVLFNQKGKFSTQNQQVYNNLSGWWNRISQVDLDGDGDEDLIVGNLGQNTQIRASEAEPATLVYDDFDRNGTIDCFMNYYIQGKSYPAHTRDEIGEQMPTLRKTFTNYQLYANATIEQFADANTIEKANHRTINELRTLVLENRTGANGTSELIPHELPQPAQYAPVYAILPQDFNQDGRPDFLLMGNNSMFRLRIGKVDANQGVMLLNRGNWRFDYVPSARSGLLVKGDVRDAKRLGNYVLVGQNNDKLLTFRINH